MQVLKLILLLTPFKVLAHPGHDELLIQAGANDWLFPVVWLLLTLVAAVGIRHLENRRKRVKARTLDD